MRRALRARGLRTTLTLVAAAGAATLTAAGAAANAAPHYASSHAPNACIWQVHGKRVGRIGGIVRALPVRSSCPTHITDDKASGTPPLIFHGGSVMDTATTGPLVVTPIFWNPAGHPMSAAYKSIITTYLNDVAAASGQFTNVYSVATEYTGIDGRITNQIQLGTPINDTSPLPRNGCLLNGQDNRNIYADGSGYNACLDDAQIIAQTESVVSANGLQRNDGHIYVLYLPKGVESCFFGGKTIKATNACTINHQPSAAFCAYHSIDPNGMVYANMPYPIYASPVGFTCSSDARFPVVQTPNGNADADTEISPTSHEIIEAMTDPDTATGWYDSSGFEIGDECAYIYGATTGPTGAVYNQVINGHHYLTQEEFSNNDFAQTGLGCIQSEPPPTG